jgi:hypothetical protein
MSEMAREIRNEDILMLTPGEIASFKVNSKSKDVYAALYELLEQFKRENIVTFEIEFYGFTCKAKKVPIYFINKIGEWTPESLDLERLENFLAIMQEHANTEIFVNVLFYPSFRTKV